MSMLVLDPAVAHRLIQEGFKMRDRAYAPYSKFHVGAALLCEDGTIVGGCNVENASYGAAICAERTAIPKAVSEGHRTFQACVVTSLLPTPSVSPCGICRQVLREFLPLSAPIIMLGADYPTSSEKPPTELISALSSHGYHDGESTTPFDNLIKIMTLEQLLPMSFGPEQLEMSQ